MSQIARGYDLDQAYLVPQEEIDTTVDFYNIFENNEHEDYIYGQRRERKIGLFEFEPGEHTMRLVCVGSNPLTTDHKTGKLHYNLTADILSLRRLEFVDTEKWIKDALEFEKKQQEKDK